MAELAKLFNYRGLPPPLWYWPSRDGWEVGLLVELRGRPHPVEIKATATPRPAHAESLARWCSLAGDRAGKGLLVTRPGGVRCNEGLGDPPLTWRFSGLKDSSGLDLHEPLRIG